MADGFIFERSKHNLATRFDLFAQDKGTNRPIHTSIIDFFAELMGSLSALIDFHIEDIAIIDRNINGKNFLKILIWSYTPFFNQIFGNFESSYFL